MLRFTARDYDCHTDIYNTFLYSTFFVQTLWDLQDNSLLEHLLNCATLATGSLVGNGIHGTQSQTHLDTQNTTATLVKHDCNRTTTLVGQYFNWVKHLGFNMEHWAHCNKKQLGYWNMKVETWQVTAIQDNCNSYWRDTNGQTELGEEHTYTHTHTHTVHRA